jgi:hypothetical protein
MRITFHLLVHRAMLIPDQNSYLDKGGNNPWHYLTIALNRQL